MGITMRLLGTLLVAGLNLIPLRPAFAASAAEIDREVTAALGTLYRSNQAARLIGWQARAVLVFPSVGKAGFIIGGEYGNGALRKAGMTSGYYNTAAASLGLQAGIEKFGYALFFMTDTALRSLDKSGGWAIGTGPRVVVVNTGLAKSLTPSTLRDDVYAFIFDQKGLMIGISLQGSKITKIKPHR